MAIPSASSVCSESSSLDGLTRRSLGGVRGSPGCAGWTCPHRVGAGVFCPPGLGRGFWGCGVSILSPSGCWGGCPGGLARIPGTLAPMGSFWTLAFWDRRVSGFGISLENSESLSPTLGSPRGVGGWDRSWGVRPPFPPFPHSTPDANKMGSWLFLAKNEAVDLSVVSE